MKAGRELDALVAEKVFGWVVGEHPEKNGSGQWYEEYGEPVYFHDGTFTCAGSFNPSEEIADAWLVVEKIDQQVTVTKCADGWLVTIDDYFCHGGVEIMAGTAPLAICLAALKAVGVDITDNNAT